MDGKKRINLTLSSKTNMTINTFNDQIWIHFFQHKKDKSVSLRKSEIKKLFEMKNKILKGIKSLEKGKSLTSSKKKRRQQIDESSDTENESNIESDSTSSE